MGRAFVEKTATMWRFITNRNIGRLFVIELLHDCTEPFAVRRNGAPQRSKGEPSQQGLAIQG